MTAPGLSVVVSIRATTFFGAVAGDHFILGVSTTIIFLISYLFIWPSNANIFWCRCWGQSFSVPGSFIDIHLLIFLISHLSWQIQPFGLSSGSFIALFFAISVASLRSVFCLGGDSTFSFFPDKKLSSYLLVVTFWILELDSLFKWRLHFSHFLIFLSRNLFLSSIWSLIIHHGLFVYLVSFY